MSNTTSSITEAERNLVRDFRALGMLWYFIAGLSLFVGAGAPFIDHSSSGITLHPMALCAIGLGFGALLWIAARKLRSGERNNTWPVYVAALLHLPGIPVGTAISIYMLMNYKRYLGIVESQRAKP